MLCSVNTSIKDDSAKILSAISSSSRVKEETNPAFANAVKISFMPLARIVILSAAIAADTVGVSV